MRRGCPENGGAAIVGTTGLPHWACEPAMSLNSLAAFCRRWRGQDQRRPAGAVGAIVEAG